MSAVLQGSAIIDLEHPWPGLMPFTENASAFFHGRDTETAELQRLIKRETLTILFGQSGLGKSSLLHAGLFPRLRAEDFLPIYIRLDMAETAANFAAQVKAAIATNCAAHGVDAPPPGAEETLWQYFHRQDVDFWSARNRLLTPLLVFDQFEEIFTLGGHAEALAQRCQAFLEELADLIEDRMPTALAKQIEARPELGAQLVYNKRNYKVLFSFREDYLPEFEGLRNLIRPIMQNRMRLTRMSGDQALAAIMQSGGHLAPEDIAEQIVRFVAAPRADRARTELSRLEVEPALMSVVCRELNNQRLQKGQRQITAELLHAGAQQRIIQDFYEGNLQDVDPRVRVFIEDQLLTDAGYRDSCALEDALAFPGVTRDIIDALIAQRLLRLEERSGILRVELTHDVLTQVARASRDRRKQAEALAAQRALDAARKKRTQRLALVGGGLLSLAVTVAVVFGILLNRANEERKRLIETQSFIALSRANAALEQGVPGEPYALLAQAIRLNPDNRAAIARGASLLLQRRHAQLQLRLQLASPADFAWYDQRHFLLFDAQAALWRGLDQPAPERLQLLTSQDDYEDFGLARLQGVPLPAAARLALTEHPAGGGILPYQAEARLLPFVSRNRVLHLFDPQLRKSVGKPLQLTGAVRALAVSPGRQWVAVLTQQGQLLRARLDGTAQDSASLAEVALAAEAPLAFVTDQGVAALRAEQDVWLVRDKGTQRIPASADLLLANAQGSLFAIVHRKTVQLYDAQGSAVGKPLVHPATVRDLAFSPDGRHLATACLDKQARLWDSQTQTLAGPPLKHYGAVLTVRFGDDAQTLATGSADGALRIWQPFRAELLVEPMMHPDAVAELALQPGGHQVLALTNGQEFFIWQWRHAQQPDSIPVASASSAFASAGLRVAFGTADGSINALPLQQPPQPLWRSPPGAFGVEALAFSADATVLAEARANATLQLRDGKTGQALGVPLAHSQLIQAQRFSPDGSLLATATKDGFVRVWDVRRQQLLGARLPHRPGIQSLAFSPDGRQLLVAERERVLLWDAHTLQTRGELDLGKTVGTRIALADFSATGDQVLVVDGDRILLINLVNNKNKQRSLDAGGTPQNIPLGDFKTWTATLSADRRRLALGSLDGRMRTMQLDVLRFVGEVMHHDDAVLGMAFSSDGKTLTSWSRDRSVRVWDVQSGYAIADAVITDTEPLAAMLSPQHDLLAIAPAQGQGFLRHIGSVPQGVAPDWLPDLLEAAGGTRLDQSGSSERLRDRAADLRRLQARLQTAPPAWRTWGMQILAQLMLAPAQVAPAKGK